jgi:hypothetical protein
LSIPYGHMCLSKQHCISLQFSGLIRNNFTVLKLEIIFQRKTHLYVSSWKNDFFVFAERSLPAIALLKWGPERGMLLSILVTPLLEYNYFLL